MIEARDEGSLADTLQKKIKVLHDSIWERRADWPQVSAWLNQFKDEETTADDPLHALYLLSNFMYFGTNEIRALLTSLYRDVFRSSVIAEIRRCQPALRVQEAKAEFEKELLRTRFVSLGNPSESSAFLLYYFRQENMLPRECFISAMEVFSFSTPDQLAVRNTNIQRYVFIDDMCGSGQQGMDYSRSTVVPLKTLKPDARVYYYALFGTASGINRLRQLNCFRQGTFGRRTRRLILLLFERVSDLPGRSGPTGAGRRDVACRTLWRTAATRAPVGISERAVAAGLCL